MHIIAAADDANGTTCYLRRRTLASLETPPDDADVTAGTTRGAPCTIEQFAAPLAQILTTGSDAVARAVRAEIGLLLDGTEDILVPVTLTTESGSWRQTELLNDWLDTATDDDITAALDDFDDIALDEVVHHYADRDDDLYELLAEEAIFATTDLAHLDAWAARHRPHLLEAP